MPLSARAMVIVAAVLLALSWALAGLWLGWQEVPHRGRVQRAS
jgi:hypothetical protein